MVRIASIKRSSQRMVRIASRERKLTKKGILYRFFSTYIYVYIVYYIYNICRGILYRLQSLIYKFTRNLDLKC